MSAAAPPTARSRPARARTGRERGPLLLLGAAGAVVALGAGAPTWLTGSAATATGARTVLASGRDAAPVATAVALVSLAAVVAAVLGRRVARAVAAVVLLLGGAGVLAASLAVLTSPAAALDGAARAASGTTSPEVTRTSVRPWPVVSAAGGALVTLAGVGVLVRGRGWETSSRHERDAAATATAPAQDPAAAWDSLTHGQDPTREDPTRDEPVR